MRSLFILCFLSMTALFKAQSLAPLCFSASSSYTSGYGFGLVSADFNGDRIPDMMTGVLSASQAALMTGHGDGSFAPPVTFSTGDYPCDLVSGRFNADTLEDAVVLNEMSNTVSLLLGTGTGSFLPQQVFAVGNLPKAIIKGDFNSDSYLDIAISNYLSGTISVLLGTGTGSFMPAANYAANSGAQALTSGDYNHDGKADLALTMWTSSYISVFYGNGDGTFQPRVNFPLYTFDNYPAAISTADFNHDGYDDLVVNDELSYNVNVLMGSPTQTLAPYITIGSTPGTLNTNVYHISTADVNGDGHADVVVPKTVIWLGTGTGSFVQTATFTNTIGNSVLADDLNADGKIDLALISDSLRIMLAGPILHTGTMPAFICPAHQLTLSVSGAGNYSWNNGATTNTISVSPNITTNYTVTGTMSNGCTNHAMITVSVVANPDTSAFPYITLQALNPGTVCIGDQIHLCANGAVGYTWSTGSNDGCILPAPTIHTTYSVAALASNGCLKTMSYTQEVAICTGLQQWSDANNLLVYPNPSCGSLQLETTAASELSLINSSGEIVMYTKVGQGKQTLDLSAHAAGIYLLLIKNNAGQSDRRKIVLQK